MLRRLLTRLRRQTWLKPGPPAPTASQRAARKVLALGMLTATSKAGRRLG